MKRLILELRSDGIQIPSPNVIAIELVQLLDATVDEYAAIWRVRLNGTLPPRLKREQREVLGTEPDGSLIVFSKGPHWPWVREKVVTRVNAAGIYIDRVFRLERGVITMGLVGAPRNLRGFLAELKGSGIAHKVLNLREAGSQYPGALPHLTEKQRKAISAAHRLGYFAVPRHVDLAGLSRTLGIARATLNEHLRRAQSRIVADALDPERN